MGGGGAQGRGGGALTLLACPDFALLRAGLLSRSLFFSLKGKERLQGPRKFLLRVLETVPLSLA